MGAGGHALRCSCQCQVPASRQRQDFPNFPNQGRSSCYRRSQRSVLTLDLNSLEVDSFETSQLGGWKGTVDGAEDDATAGGNTQCGGIETTSRDVSC